MNEPTATPTSTTEAAPSAVSVEPSTPTTTKGTTPGAALGVDTARHLRWQAPMVTLALATMALAVLLWPKAGPKEAMVETAAGDEVLFTEVSSTSPVTVVHFWSTWCPPCRDEVPAIQRLATDFGADDQVRLLMVAVDDDPNDVEEFLAGSGDSYYDPDWDLARRFGTEKLPETFVMVDGKVFEKFVGATDWDARPVRSRITAAIAVARDV